MDVVNITTLAPLEAIQFFVDTIDAISIWWGTVSNLVGFFTSPAFSIFIPLAATPTYRLLRRLKSSEHQRNAALCIQHPQFKAGLPARALTAVLVPLRLERIVSDRICAICRK